MSATSVCRDAGRGPARRRCARGRHRTRFPFRPARHRAGRRRSRRCAAPARAGRRAHGRLPRARARQGVALVGARRHDVRHRVGQPASGAARGAARRGAAAGGDRRPSGPAAGHRRQPDHRPGRALPGHRVRRRSRRGRRAARWMPTARPTSISSSTSRSSRPASGLPPSDRPSRAKVRASRMDGPELAMLPHAVVVAGDDAGPRARVFAEQAGLPLLAEPSSGARNGDNALDRLPAAARARAARRADRPGRRLRPPDAVPPGHRPPGA